MLAAAAALALVAGLAFAFGRKKKGDPLEAEFAQIKKDLDPEQYARMFECFNGACPLPEMQQWVAGLDASGYHVAARAMADRLAVFMQGTQGTPATDERNAVK